jgi:hypothetical protein
MPLHGRTYHPQTQGKVERLHGTVELEVLRDGHFTSSQDLQARFDRFRQTYNFERPHEALGMDVPASRYRMSERKRPAWLPEVTYPAGAVLRTGTKDGWISWRGVRIEVGTGLCGERVEIRDATDGIEIYYGPYRVLGATLAGHRRVRGDAPRIAG